MLVVVMVMLAVLYWPAPNARQKNFRWVSPGAVVAVVIWVVASAAFAFYVANFGAERNAEPERARELEEGVPGAEEEIKAPYRRTPKDETEAQPSGPSRR